MSIVHTFWETLERRDWEAFGATVTSDGETVPSATFFDLAPDGRIAGFTEFWPEPYVPPPGREHLVEPLPD